MKSPFPGMDPFIEAQHLWGDFHDDLIIELKRAIQRQLPPGYVARTSDRTYFEWTDPDLDVMLRSRFGPDVEVQRQSDRSVGTRQPSPTLAVVDPPSAQLRGQVEFEEREIYLDIFKLDPEKQLVTSIEVLSPTNKRRGSMGWQQYLRKRHLFLHGHANLVEIDLLRAGTRHSMSEAWPDSPFAIAVFRRERAPVADIWPAFTLQPLPSIAIPLQPPDADVAIALQPIVDEIYEAAAYAGDIDYAQPIEPPLSQAKAEVLATFSRESQP